MPWSVRPARAGDLAVLREIERAAGERYRDFGLDHVADDEPPSVEALSGYADGGRAWVASEADGAPAGYLLIDEVDGAGHIAQVSVRPEFQRRGAGRTLVERAAEWATDRGMDALTLTTFGHPPWNRPLYERLGFRVLGGHEIGPGLRAVQSSEAAQGLDPALRVAMRRQLGSAPDVPAPVGVQVRMARPGEVGAAAEVYLRSRRAAAPAIPPSVHGDDDVRRWYADTVFSQRQLWIAEEGAGRVVGVLVLDGDFVDQLYVDPGHWRVGVGSKLLAVAKSLRPRGLQLWAFQSNEVARRFYEERGFCAVELTDGARNEERTPDVRYVWTPG